jgi:predicted RNA-binding Zn ribbon-like protein
MVDHEFTFLGDSIWLDFVNTARGRVLSPPDLLADDRAFERWAVAQGLGPLNGEGLSLDLALQFRERLSALAEALDAQLQPPSASIVAINAQLAHTSGSHQLTRICGEWQLRFAPSRQPAVLEAIARSAAACLADPLLYVRRCAGTTCSLFFSDDSPNQSRRWCSAEACGREARVERRRGLLR